MVKMIGMMRLIIRDSTDNSDEADNSDFTDFWIFLIAKYTCTKNEFALDEFD